MYELFQKADDALYYFRILDDEGKELFVSEGFEREADCEAEVLRRGGNNEVKYKKKLAGDNKG